jgi:hypothetical protein
MIDMLVFHPMRVGILETLNWSDTSSSNMRKHACWMFLNEFHLFCTLVKMAIGHLYHQCGRKLVYTTTAPGLVGSWRGFGSRSAYTIGAKIRPDHPWMTLCGNVSCFNARTICFHSALILLKSGRGHNLGGILRNPTTSSKVIVWSILLQLHTYKGATG